MGLLALDLIQVQKFLVRFLLELEVFNFSVHLFVLHQAFKFGFNFPQNLLKSLLFYLGIIKCLFHLLKLFIKDPCAGDFFQHVQESPLTFLDQILHLTLLDYLELGLGLEGKTTTFKQIEQLFFADRFTIKKEVFSVSLSVIALPYYQFICFNRDSSARVV